MQKKNQSARRQNSTVMCEKSLGRQLRAALAWGVLGGVACLAAAPLDALAQAPAQEEKKAETAQKVVVTGSHIKRAEMEGSSPLQVLTTADIAKSGAKSVSELLETLSANNNVGGQFRTSNTNTTTPGAAAASLRGLGPNTTLVLLNGRRISYYGFTDGFTFVDLNSIPFAAIERVEIVKDGASAIYGADALGGVINFILKKTYEGVELSAGSGRSQSFQDMLSRNATLTAGLRSESGVNMMAVIDYFKRDHVMQSARPQTYKDFTARALENGYQLSDQNKNGTPYFNRLSTYSSAGNFWGPNPNNRGAREYWANRECSAPNISYSGPLRSYVANKACLVDASQFFTLVPAEQRVSGVARMNYDVSPSLSLFGEVTYSSSQLDYDYFPIGTGSTGSWFSAGTYGVPASVTSAWGGIYYNAIFPELSMLHRRIKNDTGRALAGAKGEFANWDWESAVGIATTKTDMQGQNYLNMANWNAGVNSFDIFSRPLTANQIASLHAPHTRYGQSEFQFADAKLSGEVARMAAGPVMLAVGVGFQHEEMSDGVDAATVSGDVTGGYVRAPISGQRDSYNAYAELAIPLHKTVEMQVAGRFDHYSDFGNSANPKIALRWQPSSSLMLRSSYSTGFRAPSIPEMNGGSESWGSDPTLNTNRWQSTAKFRYLNAQDLQPEKSESMNLGVILEPVKNWSVGVDAWSILRKNQVYTPNIMTDRDKLIQTIPETATLPTIYVFKNINLGYTKIEGVDIDVKARMSLNSWGALQLSSVWTNTLRYETSDSAGLRDWLDSYGYARWKGVSSLGWKQGAWFASLTHNYRDSYQAFAQNAAQTMRIKAYSTADLYLAYTGWNKLKLAAGIKNIEGKAPPFDLSSGLGQVWEDDAHGRQIFANVHYQF